MSHRPFAFTAAAGGVLLAALIVAVTPPPPAPAGDLPARIAAWSLEGRGAAIDALLADRSRAERAALLGSAFQIVHPLADAGQDARTADLMERVLAVSPGNFQARYHAGMGAWALGDPARARLHLERFLVDYPHDDGWTRNAREVLGRL